MIEEICKEQELLLLDLSLEYKKQDIDTIVLFSVFKGGERVLHLDITIDELQLPPRVEKESMYKMDKIVKNCQVPEYLIIALQSVVKDYLKPEEPLWLNLSPPYGLLPMVNWEALIQPYLKRPILRLHNQLLQPAVPRKYLEIAVCFSAPCAREVTGPNGILFDFFKQIPHNILNNSKFHVFADSSIMPALKELHSKLSEDHVSRIRLYDPPETLDFDGVEEEKETEWRANGLDNPWLLWIYKALDNRPVDIVHFLCHGYYLGQQQGALSLARLIRDDSLQPQHSNLVNAQQLKLFLDKVGAWSLAFTSLKYNHSKIGLYLLQEQISRLRPGSILLHDAALNDDKSLHDSYLFLYDSTIHSAPQSPAVRIYCHPARIYKQVLDDIGQKILNEYTLAGSLKPIQEDQSDFPSWVVNSQRLLEQSAVNISRASTTEEEKAAKRGTAKALSFVANLIVKEAYKFSPTYTVSSTVEE